MTPKVGEIRVVPGPAIPVLYPGEQATALVDLEVARQWPRGRGDAVPVQDWIIEPTPGWYGAWLRWRYRVWGRWASRGQATLDASVTAHPVGGDVDEHEDGY